MAEMQASLAARPDVSKPFEVRLVRPSTVVNATGANTQRLHQALDAAKHAHWEELQTVLFPEGSDACALSPRVLNSVPHPRNYGLLHHLAYSGAVDAYQRCCDGVWLDSTVLTSQGETAEHIAHERQHSEFARLLTISAEGATASARVLGTTGTLSCRRGRFGKFQSVKVDISSDGVLTMGSETADLKQAGTLVAVERATRDRPFGLILSVVNPARTWTFNAGSAEEQQRWLAGMEPFVPSEVHTGAAHREYTFAMSLCGVEVADFSVQHVLRRKSMHSSPAKVCALASLSDP